MAPRQFVRRTALRQGQRRQSLWLFSAWTNVTVATGGAAILTSLNAAALALRPFTVVRSRGFLHIATDQAGTTENQALIYGRIVVKDEALAIGITAVPTPESQSASDWHVFEPMATRFQLNSAIGFVHPAGFGMQYDSKAMRKVDLGDDLIDVVEVGLSGPSEGVLFRSFSRVLLKLH